MASFLDTYNKMSSAPMYSLEGSDKDEMLGAFRKMGQGATLESSDEIEAKLRSIFGEKTYKENYDEIHENMDMFEEKYPVADNMAYLTGMASTAAVGFTPKMIQLASKLSPTKLGALVGLFEGTMASEPGLSNRASGGALGTILGGTIGKALEKVSPGVLNLLNKFKTETPSSALPSNNMSDSIQDLRDSASKLRSEKGALPVSSKPTVAELRKEANIQRFGYDPNDILDTPVVRTATDDTGFESYLEEVNPNFKRIAAEDRPNLMMGDMYGMLPRNSEVVGSQGKVTFHRATNGDHYATAYNPDIGEEDVIGYITNRGDGTELAVVQEMQGQGIGGELQYLFRQENPKALTGGLTESGERSLQRTYDRLLEERPDDLTDSIKALRDSAKKLNFRS